MIIMSRQIIVTETVLVNEAGNGSAIYIDEFPGIRTLSNVINYLIFCKKGAVKSINVKYKENNLL